MSDRVTKRPDIAPGSHPIETGTYVIMTPAIHELWIEITEWLELRILGALVIGTQRYGKTRAIRLLKALIKNTYGESFPVFSFEKEHLKRASRGELFSNILYDFDQVELSMTGTLAKKKGRILNTLTDAAINSGTMRLVLFVDDVRIPSQFRH